MEHIEINEAGKSTMREFSFTLIALDQVGAPSPGLIADILSDINTALDAGISNSDLGAIGNAAAALERLRLALDTWSACMMEQIGGGDQPNPEEPPSTTESTEHYLQEKQEQRKRVKSAIFTYLTDRYPQVAHIEIYYGGFGGEGCVYGVRYYDKIGSDENRIELKDEQLDKLIDNVFSHVVPDGFEINEGGEGRIHVYPTSQKIFVHHFQNVVNQKHESYET